MERITITDGDDVKAFIEAQDEARQQACATFIASRAALRVAPYAISVLNINALARKSKVKAFAIWHPVLLSSVAANMPIEEIEFFHDHYSVSAFDIDFYAEAHANVEGVEYAWYSIALDAETWLKYADSSDGKLPIDVAPLCLVKNPLEQNWHHLRKELRAADTPDPRGADWSFWVKWYDDILAGNPQNWNMLHEIATTDAIDWDASAREVNDRINKIVERYRLRDEVVALRREVEQLRSATQYPPRNHNNPPELVADAPEVQEQLTIIWAAAREAEEELEKPKPDRSILAKAGQAISNFAIWLAKYCGKKMDLVINTTITTVIKWGVPAAGAIYLSDPQKITALGAALKSAAGF